MAIWWTTTDGPQLAQGDLLPDCLLPVFLGIPADSTPNATIEQAVKRARLIVVTQSCDLENEKVQFVALCPIHTLDEFEVGNPDFKKRGKWETVRKGRLEGLHMLAGTDNPGDNRMSLVVDFSHIVSLPLAYLTQHASSLGSRSRLESPFLEHFSQAFARFFMRVGLPSAIPEFR